MNIKAVIFDKDGVLINSEKLKAEAWEQTLSFYGVKDGFNWYLRNLGPTSEELAKIAKNKYSLNINIEKLANKWFESYQKKEINVEPIIKNLNFLQSLSKLYKIAVASSMDKKTIKKELQRFGYLKYVTLCISGEDLPSNKPAPDIYLKVIKTLGINSENCVAIEDSPSGITSAKTAGIYCIGYKNSLYNLDLSQADEVVTKLSDISVLKEII